MSSPINQDPNVAIPVPGAIPAAVPTTTDNVANSAAVGGSGSAGGVDASSLNVATTTQQSIYNEQLKAQQFQQTQQTQSLNASQRNARNLSGGGKV